MAQTTSYPVYTTQEGRSRTTFLALMWALSYPGKVQLLSLDDFADKNHYSIFTAIADTLLDLETSYFTPDPVLAAQLHYTGARALPANRAAYHFYPVVNAADLDHIETASKGSPLYPDQSATLILGCSAGSINSDSAKTSLLLEGPGIQKHMAISFSGIPGSFWLLREHSSVYPTGWDVFLIDAEGRLLGIPRSTVVHIVRLEE